MRNIFILLFLLLVPPDVSGDESYSTRLSAVMYNQYKTWREARAFCRENHIDLLTIENEEENQLPNGFWGWIGLYRENIKNEWKWSRGDKNADYLNFRNDDKEPRKHCAVRWDTGKWSNKNCGEKYAFLCSDSLLFLVKENKTWEEALNHCRSLAEEDIKLSYDLATLISEEDHEFARLKAQNATTDEVWTGLRFLGDAWYWMSGEKVTYQNISHCPNFGCGVLEKNTDTSFAIKACNEKRNFLCSRMLYND